mmetsp:Transcript_37081/g.72841  ORF Transcript_37081/g.72841 Transcript_37081/m.72841 type:complete len:282 (-) Transcript_37081:147-992(-)
MRVVVFDNEVDRRDCVWILQRRAVRKSKREPLINCPAHFDTVKRDRHCTNDWITDLGSVPIKHTHLQHSCRVHSLRYRFRDLKGMLERPHRRHRTTQGLGPHLLVLELYHTIRINPVALFGVLGFSSGQMPMEREAVVTFYDRNKQRWRHQGGFLEARHWRQGCQRCIHVLGNITNLQVYFSPHSLRFSWSRLQLEPTRDPLTFRQFDTIEGHRPEKVVTSEPVFVPDFDANLSKRILEFPIAIGRLWSPNGVCCLFADVALLLLNHRTVFVQEFDLEVGI